MFWDETFFSMKEKRRRTYLHRSRDQARWTKGNHRVLLFGAGGKGARNWEEVLKDLKRRGIQRVRILLTDDFFRVGGGDKKIFSEVA